MEKLNNKNLEIITKSNEYSYSSIKNNLNILTEYLNDNNISLNELKETLERLEGQENKIKDFNDKNWFSKITYRGAKWEEQAIDVYKGLKFNFLLNRDNSKALIQVMKILIGDQFQINKNINEVTKIISTLRLSDKEKLNKLEEMEDFLKEEKKINREEFEKLKNGLNGNIEIAEEFIEMIEGIGENYKEKTITIEEKIIDLEKKNIILQTKITKLKNNKIFDILTIINSIILLMIIFKIFLK